MKPNPNRDETVNTLGRGGASAAVGAGSGILTGMALNGNAVAQESGGAGVAMPEQVEEIVGVASETVDRIAATEGAVEASEAVVGWIEAVSFIYHPWVNWLLVALGVSLFVSHVGQLVLGKLWVALRHRGWNWGEIMNDLLVCVFAGLALPAVLIIPAGYGSFIGNPVAVLSATGVGALLGIYLYWHGVRQESLAQRGKAGAGAEKAEAAA